MKPKRAKTWEKNVHNGNSEKCQKIFFAGATLLFSREKNTWFTGHQEDPVDYCQSSTPTGFSMQNSLNKVKDVKYHNDLRVFHFRLKTD